VPFSLQDLSCDLNQCCFSFSVLKTYIRSDFVKFMLAESVYEEVLDNWNIREFLHGAGGIFDFQNGNSMWTCRNVNNIIKKLGLFRVLE